MSQANHLADNFPLSELEAAVTIARERKYADYYGVALTEGELHAVTRTLEWALESEIPHEIGGGADHPQASKEFVADYRSGLEVIRNMLAGVHRVSELNEGDQ